MLCQLDNAKYQLVRIRAELLSLASTEILFPTSHGLLSSPLDMDRNFDNRCQFWIQEEKKSDDTDDDPAQDTEKNSVHRLDSMNAYDDPLRQLQTDEAPNRRQTGKQIKSQPVVRVLGYVMRSLLMDLPLFVVLLLYAAVVWLGHVHDNYLVPQLKSMVFENDREESTYYHRKCDDASEMTTRNGADLFLPTSATKEDAYHHQLKHGFTVFQGVLEPQTAENLRNFVLSKNHNLKTDEIIYVIENDNRYSFGLGTEEPSVAAAMKQLATSPRLRPALEAILGPDPALIEMTAITSTYGAAAQWWHDDVYASASAVQFGRYFSPSYSVFIQLQNTTKAMGATEACPGTHFCGGGSMKQFCEESGFQIVGEEGHWGQGDALLMNMNSWHRGAAHTDPDAMDRVMLILTFVPKPITRSESRQMSQGITFSLRWDMWGHTLNDLAKADTAMTQPWATLRSLGLYKAKSSSWGIDYISSSSMRIANNDNGFQQDNLETFLERGGFWFLPDWLENFAINWDADESWPEYLSGTRKLCEQFFEKVSKVALAAFVFLCILLCNFKPRGRRFQRIGWSLFRLSTIVLCVSGLFYLAKSSVDNSGWAKDISAGRMYGSTVAVERAFVKTEYALGPSTYPTKQDVLIETRYGSEYLAIYNDFVTEGHPGNRKFRAMVKSVAGSYDGYPADFKNKTARFIVESIATKHGRFLYQGPDGYWFLLDSSNAMEYVKKELTIASSAVLIPVMRAARFMESSFKYGIHRDSALARKHAVPFTDNLRKRLLRLGEKRNETQYPGGSAPQKALRPIRTTALLPPHSPARVQRRDKSLHVPPVFTPPHHGAWLSQGDVAECYEHGNWYFGTLVSVTAFGDYALRFSDGTMGYYDQYAIRPFSAYYVGERLECYIHTLEDFEPCTIREVSPKDTFLAALDDENDKHLYRQFLGHFRRPGPQLKTKFEYVDLYHGDK